MSKRRAQGSQDSVNGAFSTLFGPANLSWFQLWTYQIDPAAVNIALVIANGYRQWSGPVPEFRVRQQAERLRIAFGYSAGMGEVLAGSIVCRDLHAK
jgi:hypothetical protein